MAVPNWTGRQGDTAKPFEFTCRANGVSVPIDAGHVSAVVFHLSKAVGKPAIISAPCAVLDDGSTPELVGKGEYRWADGETDDLVGFYVAEVQTIDATTGKPQTYPDGIGEYVVLQFSRQLA